MHMRTLTEADADGWWRLRLRALQQEPWSFVESPDEHEAKGLESAKTSFRNSGPARFVVGVFEEDSLAGMAGFYRHRHEKFEHKGHIWGVYVRPESRRRGMARAMMTDVITRARAVEGIEQVTLVVAANQPGPRDLYLSLGFKLYGVEPKSLKIGTEYVDDELMVLFL